jgi:high affinity Mn2+ porin
MRILAIRLSSALVLQTAATATALAGQASSPAYFSWAGMYFGASAGGAVPLHSGETFQAASGFGAPVYDLNPPGRGGAGVTFGVSVGYNWQHGQWVYGAETELNFLDGRRAPAGTFPAPAAFAAMGVNSYTLSPYDGGNYFGSFRGRVGYAFDRALIYATAGIASGGWRGASTLVLNGGGPGNPFVSGETASSRMKYVVGGGVEYALGDHWSARAEYLFLDQSFGTQVFDNGNMYDFVSRTRSDSHVFRLGLFYNLGEPNTFREATNKKDSDGAKSSNGSSPANAFAFPNVGAVTEGNMSSTATTTPKINPTTPTDTAEAERYSVHGQTTVLPQSYPRMRALYTGTNSLPPDGQVRATVSSTGFFGVKLWDGGEAYVNPEIDEGYGLQGTLGAAGFPSAEAYKIGHARPYLRFQRYFVRQTFGLGGDSETIDPGQNLLGGPVDGNRLTFTVGKYSVADIFDDNRYAHDARNGFMNWSVIELGAFDYPADAWGFTHGATAEWKQDSWTARGGLFQISTVPNGETIEPIPFRQFGAVGEFEIRHNLLFNQPGKIKLLGFADFAYLGKFDEAVYFGLATNTTPDITQVRAKRTKAGGGINIEQPISDDLGFFLRAGLNNGRYETVDFSDIHRSLSAGLVLTGAGWDRPKDAIGLAGVVNGISGNEAKYLGSGGLTAMIGDGMLSYSGEHILEAYYKYNLADGVHITGDYQFIDNPAYNAARGPANIFALRLHGEF